MPARDKRVAITLLDSRSWLELYSHGRGFLAEYHQPVRVASSGRVDRPVKARGPLELAVARVLAGTPHDPVDVLAKLRRRWEGAVLEYHVRPWGPDGEVVEVQSFEPLSTDDLEQVAEFMRAKRAEGWTMREVKAALHETRQQ